MSLEDLMKRHGFRVSASCAGQGWYTKFIDYKGRRAYVTVMDKDAQGLPQSLEEPVLVAVYDVRSGDELEDSQNISSLKSYLESLME